MVFIRWYNIYCGAPQSKWPRSQNVLILFWAVSGMLYLLLSWLLGSYDITIKPRRYLYFFPGVTEQPRFGGTGSFTAGSITVVRTQL